MLYVLRDAELLGELKNGGYGFDRPVPEYQSILTYSFAPAVNAIRPFGRYTSLILSSYGSYRLNTSSSLTYLTAPFWVQYALGGLRERHVTEPSTATYASTM
jgi:hypothetical protein